MSQTIAVPCFRYFNQALNTDLAVEELDGRLLVRCLVRKGLYNLNPEERVRQALLWFFLKGANGASSWAPNLDFQVEQRSLDIAAFFAGKAMDQSFFPRISVLIGETKREEREIFGDTDTEQQLRTYMLRECCHDGLIFNGRQVAWLSVAAGQWTRDDLADMSEVEERLGNATATASTHALACRDRFIQASRGDFDSLLDLVSLFGNDLGLSFFLSVRIRGSVQPVQAFTLQVLDSNTVGYRSRGISTRNRQILARHDFHALVAIR